MSVAVSDRLLADSVVLTPAWLHRVNCRFEILARSQAQRWSMYCAQHRLAAITFSVSLSYWPSCSQGSNKRHKKAQADRLQDYEADVTGDQGCSVSLLAYKCSPFYRATLVAQLPAYSLAGPVTSGLPSALSALDGLEGPPSYLTPEATRPLASSAYHGRLVQAEGISVLP